VYILVLANLINTSEALQPILDQMASYSTQYSVIDVFKDGKIGYRDGTLDYSFVHASLA